MTRMPTLLALTGTIAFAVLGGHALIAADKYSVAVPDGLALSEFKGYETWAAVGASQTERDLKVMVANPTMIAAYQAGIPLDGQSFPDGSTIAFEVDPFRKHCLLNGLDDIGLTLQRQPAIEAFEAKRKTSEPWLAA